MKRLYRRLLLWLYRLDADLLRRNIDWCEARRVAINPWSRDELERRMTRIDVLAAAVEGRRGHLRRVGR